ncbi:MAG TPA: glycosyltransferase family 9 protein, partial [Candidatus Limnocylindria bacterium]|nr:glycosyltransferase family 9 protein [Candidatus Limnocylindria bacterium]
KTGCDWLLLGGRADVSLTEQLTAEISAKAPSARVTNLAGQTTLRELCAALKACQLVLTNDTGPMHVAAALGTPVVVPFGSTSPELTGPAFMDKSPHQIVPGAAACAPCFLRDCPIDFRCMKSISVEQMVEAAGNVRFSLRS